MYPSRCVRYELRVVFRPSRGDIGLAPVFLPKRQGSEDFGVSVFADCLGVLRGERVRGRSFLARVRLFEFREFGSGFGFLLRAGFLHFAVEVHFSTVNGAERPSFLGEFFERPVVRYYDAGFAHGLLSHHG